MPDSSFYQILADDKARGCDTALTVGSVLVKLSYYVDSSQGLNFRKIPTPCLDATCITLSQATLSKLVRGSTVQCYGQGFLVQGF